MEREEGKKGGGITYYFVKLFYRHTLSSRLPPATPSHWTLSILIGMWSTPKISNGARVDWSSLFTYLVHHLLSHSNTF